MKTLFIECRMGAAGDMLTAALLELMPDPEKALEELNALGIPKVVYSLVKTAKCGITGTKVTVCVDGVEEESFCQLEHHHHMKDHHHHHHNHSSLADIEQIVKQLRLPETVEADVLAVYRCIAQAEAKVHGVTAGEIHFHEVGTLDAVADITAACLLMAQIGAERIVVSPIRVGSGTVRCAHGILPVPAPATAEILIGMPVYAGDLAGEMCTPTGAALLKHFATEYGNLPPMTIETVGYGMGTRDFPGLNCVRAILGESL